MKKFLHKLRTSMAANIIGAIVILLLVFGSVVSIIGYVSFSDAFKEEYATSTYHMADTAATLVNGDHIGDYLAGKEKDEYQTTKDRLEIYCHKMHVSLIYVIQVDTTDYESFVSVFNHVDNTVDNSDYVAWELGYRRETTNEEYKEKYIELYEKEALYETIYRLKTTDGHHPHITTMVPIRDSSDQVTALLCIQRPMRELDEARAPYAINVGLTTFLLIAIVTILIAIFVRKQVVVPVKKAADEATRFAAENSIGTKLGQISKFSDLMNLATSIDTMESDMVRYMENLTKATAENQRVSTELNLATQIQAGMLPNIFPAFPDRPDFDIYASMDPAREVGGDFYDFFLIDDDHLCLVIADVSGKGVPAALFMMASKIVLASNAVMGKSPAQILTDTNEAICANNRMEMFVTVWLGVLELSTGKMTAANAGHEYPILKAPDGSYELIKDRHGFVIGGMSGARYKEYELMLKPGTKLFVYTDGVAEATDPNGELFTTDRLLTALNEKPDLSPEETLKSVRAAVDAFVKDAEQFDDLTMLCVEYKAKPEK